MAAVDRLVPLGVVQPLVDVRWQRHLAEAGQLGIEHTEWAEGDGPEPIAQALPQRRREVTEGELGPYAEPAARPDQRLPDVRLGRPQQQRLDAAAGRGLVAQKPRGEHARVVKDKQVGRLH